MNREREIETKLCLEMDRKGEIQTKINGFIQIDQDENSWHNAYSGYNLI